MIKVNREDIVKRTQEQATASWIGYLNKLRLDQLIANNEQQDINLSEALKKLNEALEEIGEKIEKNRGGQKGIHGFIAEIAEEGIGNARENILGHNDINDRLDNNGPVDIYRHGGIPLQLKFHSENFSLDAVAGHFGKYPDYLKNGGEYLIPKDQYDKVKYLLSIGEEEASRLTKSNGSLSFKDWKYVHDFFEKGDIDINSIKPAALEYREVQLDSYDKAIKQEKESILNTDKERRADFQQQSRSTVQEGLKVTAVSSVIEGSTTLIMSVQEKKKSGKNIKDFSSDDWTEILQKSGIGTLKGSIRGSSTYILTNVFNSSFSMTKVEDVEKVEAVNSANAAAVSALVTASFGVAEMAHQFRNGEITEKEFIENSETLCLETVVSALSSYIGQIAIPVPVLGSVIGSALGSTLYKIATDGLSSQEKELIDKYVAEIDELNQTLEEQYLELVKPFREGYEKFLEIIEDLYSVDIKESFEASIALAQFVGVNQEEILDTREKIDSYFLD